MSNPPPLVDRLALLAALNKFCTCKRDGDDISVCQGHDALVHEPNFAEHLAFGKLQAGRMEREEFQTLPGVGSGTPWPITAERERLLEAVEGNCSCEQANGTYRECQSHEMLSRPLFVRHVEFMRWLYLNRDPEAMAA